MLNRRDVLKCPALPGDESFFSSVLEIERVKCVSSRLATAYEVLVLWETRVLLRVEHAVVG